MTSCAAGCDSVWFWTGQRACTNQNPTRICFIELLSSGASNVRTQYVAVRRVVIHEPPGVLIGSHMTRHILYSQDASVAEAEALQRRVSLLEKTLAEMEATDRLRDRASAVLKEELAEMRRRETRGHVDLTYVKSVSVCCGPAACPAHAC